MTHRNLVSFTCLSLLLAACGGDSIAFDQGPEPEPTPCLDANDDGVCDDDPTPCADADDDGVCDDDDLCLGDDATGDADADGLCDEGDLCVGADDTGDTDGDGVCDDLDACAGDDATGDSDSDGTCDDADLCLGDDATGDADSDGICDDGDVCFGTDATGDDDGDLVCNDADLCFGDDASGDSDGSGTCDDVILAMAGAWTEVATAGTVGGGSPRLSDVDADGDLDLVTAHHNPRRLVHWTNTGGSLAEDSLVATSCKPLGFDLADLDGDGDIDLVAGGVADVTLVHAANLGADGYPNATNFESGAVYSNLVVMPVDGDARPDVVTFDKSNQQLILSLNTSADGAIAFAPSTVIDTSLFSNAFAGPGMAAVDVDGDNDLDLVVSTGQLTLYVNDGGTFAAPVLIDSVNLGSFMEAADIDGDGDDDILAVLANRAVWYENLGDGGFGPQLTIAEGAFANRLATGDLDGDGDADVLLRDSATNELFWVENGLNGLVLRAPIGTAQGSMAIGDLDGDGDGDVVSTTSDGIVTAFNPLF